MGQTNFFSITDKIKDYSSSKTALYIQVVFVFRCKSTTFFGIMQINSINYAFLLQVKYI